MSYGISLIPSLVRHLFQKDEKSLEVRLKNLIEENRMLGGPIEGFLYRGEFWTLVDKAQRLVAPKKVLDQRLHDAAKDLWQDRQYRIKESIRLTQGLQMLLRDCHNDQDVRDALPDCASLVLPQLAAYSRIRPPAWPFADKPLHMHNYEMILKIFTFYTTNQLLY